MLLIQPSPNVKIKNKYNSDHCSPAGFLGLNENSEFLTKIHFSLHAFNAALPKC